MDADEIARDVVEPGSPAWQKIVDHFGAGVLLPDRTINRPALGEIVFADDGRRTLLNEIIHPEVMRRIADRLEELRHTDHVVIADIPLLAEVGATEMFDIVVVVAASEQVQRDRLLRLRGMTDEHARARIAAQLPMEEKERIADVVIVNDGSLDTLVEQVEHLWRDLAANRGGQTAH